MKFIVYTVIFCLFCLVYLNYSIPSSKLLDYTSFDFMKRPLNLYITANGKHAIVKNRTFDLVENSLCTKKHNHSSVNKITNTDPAYKILQLDKIADYRVAVPPFAIKTKGSVILLHNTTGNSLSWHQGYPSVTQMLAASGQKTVSPELIHNGTESRMTNQKLINQIIRVEDLKHLTLISANHGSAKIMLDVLKSFSATNRKKTPSENFWNLVDGVVFIDAGVDNIYQIKKWQSIIPRNSNNVVPFLFIDTIDKDLSVELAKKIPETKYLHINNNSSKVNSETSRRLELMKILVNFLDFIHPR